MAWAVWLSIPVAVTVIAAVASWLRARPARAMNTEQAVLAHGEFLDALGSVAAATLPGCHASPCPPSSESPEAGPSLR